MIGVGALTTIVAVVEKDLLIGAGVDPLRVHHLLGAVSFPTGARLLTRVLAKIALAGAVVNGPHLGVAMPVLGAHPLAVQMRIDEAASLLGRCLLVLHCTRGQHLHGKLVFSSWSPGLFRSIFLCFVVFCC